MLVWLDRRSTSATSKPFAARVQLVEFLRCDQVRWRARPDAAALGFLGAAAAVCGAAAGEVLREGCQAGNERPCNEAEESELEDHAGGHHDEAGRRDEEEEQQQVAEGPAGVG